MSENKIPDETGEELEIIEETPGESGEVIPADPNNESPPSGSENTPEERLGKSEDDEEGETPSDGSKRKPYHEMTQEEKRQFRKDRKHRQQVARDRDRVELEFLRRRNSDLERRVSSVESQTAQTQILTVDQRIQGVREQIRLADEVMADSLSEGKGETFVEAQRIRDTLAENLRKLENVKTSLADSQRAPRTPTVRETPPVNPVVQAHVQKFITSNPWYRPGTADLDSIAVTQIDAEVAKEFDPASQEYWDELEERLQERLPHRFKSASPSSQESGQRRSGGPRFSTQGRDSSTPSLKPGQVFISAERRRAMEEAGVWDDPVLRKKYLKAYATYDRQQNS